MLHVGVMLNPATYRGIPAMKTRYESIANYEDAGLSYGLIPCFLHLEEIHIATGTCRAFVKHGNEYRQMTLPLPPVIHNRTLYRHNENARDINRLVKKGIYIFNEQNRFRKDHIHAILQEDPLLRIHLPKTLQGNLSSIHTLMEQIGDVVIKPSSGSVGRGIMRLRRSHGHWTLQCAHPAMPERWSTLRLHGGELPLFLHKRLLHVPHIVQETIPLALCDDRPFDIRVTVQRGYGGVWGVTGMFAKIAPSHTFVSNVAQGGTARSLLEVLSQAQAVQTSNTARLMNELERLSLQIVHRLAQNLPRLADVGLDLGITQEGKVFFIECNGRDQRYGFSQAGMNNVWKETYTQPMAYARWLLERMPSADTERSPGRPLY
ncbi:YheC/YheD family endospore coat-associated protein [Paenibacillus brasilensis]|uniref:Glutathione synthase/RimK-type ligase-like ATP-grasp enzyme n=1 Tax=Paenibacillus brasilensis TaxID=128574 RepID=A0ABU0L4C5_9BACL|nr:YheC/YheD family protein [Paenibacillus brasilensis]MDQ0496143.1 glutathione synthase/RimK-type ligase-like ATP-grasp enzyme [Paenibacillus brasilensis]